MDELQPKWRRRKAARPAEIVEAALDVFIDKGFERARLEEIAARAGVSKAALYLYFETKEELFRAAVLAVTAPAMAVLVNAGEASQAPLRQVAPAMLGAAATALGSTRAPAIARMVIAEARTFPDLATIWRENVIEVVVGRVAEMIAGGQARGEVVEGDPRLMAFSLMGPMVMGMLYREVFRDEGAQAPDLTILAQTHAQSVLHGMLKEK